MKKVIYFTLLILLPLTAEAYIGPGLGTGVIGVVLGILASIILMLIAIVWYPLKRLFKLLFNIENSTTRSDSETTEQS
ncbi:MAG TPA: hypothetical protein DHN29_06480 [Cytophagales bacterium]|jgi:hypothetical protein|nr:hypothetical protein [Cytophagales bacterium]|tara:strand:- start:549 stop:782 length:234 start_codon:yes stop_codon:yes gene_type:complete